MSAAAVYNEPKLAQGLWLSFNFGPALTEEVEQRCGFFIGPLYNTLNWRYRQHLAIYLDFLNRRHW